MRRTGPVIAMTIGLLLSTMSMAFGEVNEVTPSTNEENRDLGWAHFNVIETRTGSVEIEFVSERNFASCFEYRSDGRNTTDPRENFNTDIEDGLWPFVCMANSSLARTLSAVEYVEIRMVFGAEADERFDWTRVEVEPVPGAHGLRNAISGPAGERASDNARFNRVVNSPEPEVRGLDNAESRPAGERANENAHFNHVSDPSVPGDEGLESEKPGAAGERANENARFNR